MTNLSDKSRLSVVEHREIVKEAASHDEMKNLEPIVGN